MASTAQLPVWAAWVQWLATVLLAIGAFFVAYRQWQTARQKLMLDLFEKRFAAYRAIVVFLDSEVKDPRTLLDGNAAFVAIYQLDFLFGPEVIDFVRRAVDAGRRNDQKSIEEMHLQVSTVFAPYMDFKQRSF